jgi:hypothetical protein
MNNVNLLTKNLIYRLAGDKYRVFLDVYIAWKPIVGNLLAEKSSPFRYENGVIYIGVRNSTWMQELILLKHNIIKMYNQTHKIYVTEIIFLIKQ